MHIRNFPSTTTHVSIMLLLLTLAACNTFEGMGQDLQTGGKKLEREADENKGPDSRAVE